MDLSSNLEWAEFLPEQANNFTMAVMYAPPSYAEAVESAYLPTPIYTELPLRMTPIDYTQPPANSNTGPDSSSRSDPEHPVAGTRCCWAIVQNGCVPPNAVQAGYDTDESRNYVGRAYHNGKFLPGKYIPKHRCTYILDEGREIRKTSCEVLVGKQFIWVPVTENLALDAVKVDRNSNQMHLYVGRANYNGSVTCGKFQSSDNYLYLSSDGQIKQITNNIEILVHKDLYFRDKINN